jgi:hypothetical protein
MIEIMVCLAICAIVPLGLGLITPQKPDRAFRAIRMGHPLAAALVLVSFLLPKGPLAAGLCAPWILLTGLGALSGAGRLIRIRFRDMEQTCFGMALAFLPVGAIHLLLSRLGATVMGFQEPIVLLTAVHFHYTGFAAPILAGMAIRRFQRYRAALGMAALGLLTGIPLLAAGFVFSPLLKAVAVLLLCASLLALAIIQMASLTSLDIVSDAWAHPLLALSGLGLTFGMLLAALYESGERSGHAWIGIPMMALLHGLSNGIAFSFCGLLGWHLDRRGGLR